MHQLDHDKLPRHVAIIMDGNGRWAKKRLLNRVFGHEEGTSSVREIVRCCRELEIPYLTLYAFSKENWQRPAAEVTALWSLLRRFLKSELPELMTKQIRLLHIGDPVGIPEEVLRELKSGVAKTAHFKEMTLSLAINYGGRQEIVRAARLLAADALAGKLAPEDLSADLFSRFMLTENLPALDLMIRTGGEYRVSNFLLWQLAYAELYFTKVLWPDFRKPEFLEALSEYQRRERRFGKTGEQTKTHLDRGE